MARYLRKRAASEGVLIQSDAYSLIHASFAYGVLLHAFVMIHMQARIGSRHLSGDTCPPHDQ